MQLWCDGLKVDSSTGGQSHKKRKRTIQKMKIQKMTILRRSQLERREKTSLNRQ